MLTYLLAELLHHQVGPLGADVEGLVGIGDVRAVQHQLHYEHAVFILVQTRDLLREAMRDERSEKRCEGISEKK